MKNSKRGNKERGTIVITTQDEVSAVNTEIEESDFSLSQSLIRTDCLGDFRPITLKSKSLGSTINVNFNYQYDVEIIFVSKDGIVDAIFTELGTLSGPSEIIVFHESNFVIFAPKGFCEKQGIIMNETSIYLTKETTYPAEFCQHVWSKKLITRSDKRIGDPYNNITSRGYSGYQGNSTISELERRINSRRVDSYIIIRRNKDGSIYSIN